MEKKYIIKLEENEIAYKTVNSNGCPMIGLLHPVPYTEPDLEQVRKEAYQRGLADAWSAAKKIQDTGGNLNWWIHNVSAPEAIEKIRQHEQRQEEKITKGDVVRIKSAPEVEILVTYADGVHFSGIALTEVDDSCEIGDQYTDIVIHKVEKTGRHYEIAEVLAKMKESEGLMQKL